MLKKVRHLLRKRNVIALFTDERGESIGEVLVALLISSIGLMMLAIMITAASKMVMKSKTVSDHYIVEENVLVDQSTPAATGSIKLDEPLIDDASDTISVQYFVNTTLGKDAVVSYKKGS